MSQRETGCSIETFREHVKAEAEKISGEMDSPENWKKNEIYFSMAVIRSVEEEPEKGG